MTGTKDSQDYDSLIRCADLNIEKLRHEISQLELDKGSIRLVQQFNSEDGQTPQSRRARAELRAKLATIDLNKMNIEIKVVDVDNAIEENHEIARTKFERDALEAEAELLARLRRGPFEDVPRMSVFDLSTIFGTPPQSEPGSRH